MGQENYICIFGHKIELLAEQIEKIKSIFAKQETKRQLSDVEPGDIFKIGKHEFVVLEQHRETGKTSMIYKGLLHKGMRFGGNNNFDGSDVESACEDFADELAELIGKENIVEHEVDLLSDDGLGDYGKISRRTSLLTTEQYRRYVKILDKHKPEAWWWLATPHSTPSHENADWVKCVSPVGGIAYDCFYIGYFGVRPFCIFKSSIFES